VSRSFWVVVSLSLVLFTANLGGISIYMLDEAKNSTAAREMLDNHEWIVPTFNNELRTDKPPLHYYFMATAYRLFGVNEFAARVFSSLMGILTVICTFLFVRKLADEASAFFSSVVLLSSLHVIVQFHLAVPDPYLIALLTVSLFSFLLFYQEKKNKWLWIGYSCLGLATLTKGPVALVLVGAIIFLFLLLKKQLSFRVITSFRPFYGVLLIACIALPWYIWVHIKTDGAWTEGFFFKHNIGRFTSTMEGHGGSFLKIPLFFLAGLLPFSFFFVQTISYAWKNRHHTLVLFSSCAVLVTLTFFSFSSTKLPTYVGPALPFGAILLGHFVTSTFSGIQRIKWRWVMVLYTVFSIALPVAVFLVLEDQMELPSLRHLAFWFLPIPIGAALAIYYFIHHKQQHAFISLGGSWMTTALCFFYLVYPEIDTRNPVTKTLSLLPHQATVIAFERFNPAFSFYIKKPIPVVQHASEIPTTESIYLLHMKKDATALTPLAGQFNIVYQEREFFEPYINFLLKTKSEAITQRP